MGSRCSGRQDHCTYIEARNNGTLDQVVSIKRTTDGFNVMPLALQGQYLQNSHLWRHPVSSATEELILTSTWPEPVETLPIINWSQSIFGEGDFWVLTYISNYHSTQHINIRKQWCFDRDKWVPVSKLRSSRLLYNVEGRGSRFFPKVIELHDVKCQKTMILISTTLKP